MLSAEIALTAAALAAGLTGAWSPCGFSMVDTIGRPASGRLGTLAASCGAFAAGALAGGALTFGLLGALGGAVHGGGGKLATAGGAVLALVAALGEARGVRILPQIRRQVPETWRRLLPLPLAAALYGVLLGLGFTTFVLTLAVWALAGISFALGDPELGVLLGLAFGAGRAVPVVLMAPLAQRPLGARLLEGMAERPALLGGFRLVDAVALGCSALALAVADASAAVMVVRGASDPTVSGGLLAWDGPGGAVLRPERSQRQAAASPHHFRAGATAVPGTDPALGGSLLAWRSGATVHVVRAADFSPMAELVLPRADAVAVSDRWLAYRERRAGGGDRLAARPLGGGRSRLLASVRAPAQLGRPALDGERAVFHVSRPRSSRIVEVDLRDGRKRTLRYSRLEELTNPSILGGTLLYVRRSHTSQRLVLGARRPHVRDRTLYRTGSTALRDPGYQRGYSRVTLTPPAARPARVALWTTALTSRHAYLSLLPLSGNARRATIVRLER